MNLQMVVTYIGVDFFAMARIRRTDKRPGRLVYLICQIPIGLAMVLCLTTPWTGWVFQIAADGTY